eukprot:g4114.t1
MSSLNIHHVQDVGRILLEVQSDLKALRQKCKEGKSLDVDSLQTLITKAESDIKAKSNIVLNTILDSTHYDVPSVNEHINKRETLGKTVKSRPLAERGNVKKQVNRSQYDNLLRHHQHRKKHFSHRNVPRFNSPLANPSDQKTQKYLRERFTLRSSGKNFISRSRVSSNTSHRDNRSLHNSARKQNRKNEKTANNSSIGLLNLINRGMVSSNFDFTDALSSGNAPVTQAPMKFHEWGEQFKKTPAYVSPFGFTLTNVKFDITNQDSKAESKYGGGSPTKDLSSETSSLKKKKSEHVRSRKEEQQSDPADAEPLPIPAAVQQIRGYNDLLDKYSLYQFIIRYGRTLDTTPEFDSFRRTNVPHWGAISTVIRLLEDLMRSFAIPIAHINGQAIVALAKQEVLQPTTDDLLKCVDNIEAVAALLNKPGQRYKGEDGDHAAATKIQSTFRGFVVKRRSDFNSLTDDAARVIQMRWHCYLLQQRMMNTLREKHIQQEEQWIALKTGLKNRWPTLKTSPKILIHLPSISRSERRRLTIPNFRVRQNMQMARLCGIMDQNTEIIYVAPCVVNSDVKSYYKKLLSVTGEDVSTRYKIIFPENVERFNQHMSLTQVLLYSPRAIKKLKHFIKGRRDQCIIVPRYIGPEEKKLAIELGVPLLGPDPDLAESLSIKSGAKSIFAEAEVNIPPGAHDIYSEREAYETLTKLIASSLDVNRWILRIDDEFDGRGTAYFDVKDLPVVADLRRERNQQAASGDVHYWSRVDVQNDARRRIMMGLEQVLRKSVCICNTDIYSSWKHFLFEFCYIGGVIEAAPLQITGHPAINLFIEPDGKVVIKSTYDKLFSSKSVYVPVSESFPQKSIPHEALKGAAFVIANCLQQKNIIGHVEIEFLVYVDNYSGNLKMCALDMQFGYSNSLASFEMFSYIMGGAYDAANGEYSLEVDPSTSSLESKYTLGKSREYITIPYLYHQNLGSLQFNAFFHLCRMKGISFDLNNLDGVAFLLSESLANGTIGILAVGRSLEDKLKKVYKCLGFIKLGKIQRDNFKTTTIVDLLATYLSN